MATSGPNVLCGGGMGISNDQAAINQTPVLNINCFADPGDQRYQATLPAIFQGLRTNGIHNFDLNLHKEFVPKEGMTAEVRAEFFNFFNHPRFAPPNTSFAPGNPEFGIISSTAIGYFPRRLQFWLQVSVLIRSSFVILSAVQCFANAKH